MTNTNMMLQTKMSKNSKSSSQNVLREPESSSITVSQSGVTVKSEVIGQRLIRILTEDEWIALWAKENCPNWPPREWDYTEWEECLDSFKAYCKREGFNGESA